MTTPLRLVIFDVDGTLVDSQADIVGSMGDAFAALGLTAPDRVAVLGIVGLSLPQAMSVLAPEADNARLVDSYKQAYAARRAADGAGKSSPLYPGARAAIERLHALPDVLLGVATGKSKRGLDLLLEAHDLAPFFVTQQVADFHPSKPHPSMLHTAMTEAGVETGQTVMIGDTTFDMQMAVAAGVDFVGVGWGYHPPSALDAAHTVLTEFGELDAALGEIWKE
ncbi:HAD-IA family hydrolase [Tateyamaria sp. SN3-11]|uniref:HAD-IA family hydrolase n=1 Tax=Tateyamaria sp. SN3-11 TaxID=3092147 RepID=UPI0039EAC929